MLEALARGKPHVDRNPIEDVVTSCVFGPLSYLKGKTAAREIFSFFHLLLPGKDLNKKMSRVNEMRLDLWPKPGQVKINGDLRPRFPEPDIMIKFLDSHAEEVLVIIVEVKWGAKQFNYNDTKGRYELSEQWASLPRDLYCKSFHIYLVLDTIKAKIEIQKMHESQNRVFPYDRYDFREWKDRLLIVGWDDLIKSLEICPFNELEAWADNAVKFIERTNKVSIWRGCASAVKPNQIMKSIQGQAIFWTKPKNIFFFRNIDGSRSINKFKNPLFWKKRVGFKGAISKQGAVLRPIGGYLFFSNA